jgi:hypothetical protein
LGLAPLGQEQCHGAEQREDEHDGADDGGLAEADDGHHHDRTHYAGHGQQRGGRTADLSFGQVGRCLDGARLGGGERAGGSAAGSSHPYRPLRRLGRQPDGGIAGGLAEQGGVDGASLAR